MTNAAAEQQPETLRPARVELMQRLPVRTPAYVVDEVALSQSLDIADHIREQSGVKVLFAIKSYSFEPTIDLMTPRLDGLSASSLFEAKSAEGMLRGDDMTLHFTSPGVRREHALGLARWCTHIAYNTQGQYRNLKLGTQEIDNHGLRVNTGLSFADDIRYDPCRDDSRLGEPVENVPRVLDSHPELNGLLVHTNCESVDYSQLAANIGVLMARLQGRLNGDRLRWINLGGGYLFHDYEDNPTDLQPLVDVVRHLRSLGLEVFIEPGAALIRDSGNLVSTVQEVQHRSGHRIAVLDTTVNHLPEVYEYQFTPYVYGQDEGDYEYILAGATCLAGDVLGTYRFAQPLQRGDRVVVGYVGAYNLVKAHMFNGVNLPDIHHLTPDGSLHMMKEFSYDDYARRWHGGRIA